MAITQSPVADEVIEMRRLRFHYRDWLSKRAGAHYRLPGNAAPCPAPDLQDEAFYWPKAPSPKASS